MYNYKQHITAKITTILVVACLLLPIGIKIAHVFSHHEHEVCIGENQSHFHEIDMDCEFYKFNLNTSFYSKISAFEIFSNVELKAPNVSYYFLLRAHQQDSSYLRGPPSLG